VPLESLQPAPLRKRDRVCITSGDFVGKRGLLVGIDGSDGIVKLDDLDIKILELKSLVTVERDSGV